MKKDQKTDFLSTRVRYIPINDIRPNPQQPRRRFDPESLQELAASIAAYGILQPLTVRQQGAVYELVAGERRWRAARIAGLRQVPCLLARVDEEDAALLALIENLQRRDLDYMEEAAAIARLLRRQDRYLHRRRYLPGILHAVLFRPHGGPADRLALRPYVRPRLYARHGL